MFFQTLLKTAVLPVLPFRLAEKSMNTGIYEERMLNKEGNTYPFPNVLTVPERLLGTDGTEAENMSFSQPFRKKYSNHAGLKPTGTEERQERVKNDNVVGNKLIEGEKLSSWRENLTFCGE